MVINAAAIHEGMDVYGREGDMIGTIAAIYPIDRVVLAPEQIPPRGVVTEAGVRGRASPTDGIDERTDVLINGYVRVEQGGVLGLAITQLYIPLDVVCDVAYGERITLNCTKDACCHLYAAKPAALDETREAPP